MGADSSLVSSESQKGRSTFLTPSSLDSSSSVKKKKKKVCKPLGKQSLFSLHRAVRNLIKVGSALGRGWTR